LIDVGNGRKPRVGALDGAVIATSLDHARAADFVWDEHREWLSR
jgi:hypothetical protein